MSAMERHPQGWPRLQKGLRPRHRRERNPERPPSNSHGDWPFLRPPERVPEVPVVSREHLPQLEKIQEVLCFSRDEAHFLCGVSRVITPKLWNIQRVLHTLATTQEFPRHTRLHSRGSRGSGHLQRSSVSASKLEMRDPSLLPRERIPDVSEASQEEARCTGKARGTHG